MEIRSIGWTPNGKYLATGGEDIKIWDTKGKLISTFSSNSKGIWSLDWNSDGSKLAVGYADGVIKIWDKNGKLTKELR